MALHTSLIDPDQEEPEEPTSVMTSTRNALDKNPTWKKVREINEKFWDYTVNFFYVALTFGIVLNLTGYAYKVDLQDGLTIQTVTERRQELQWQQEMKRYGDEAAMKEKALLQKSDQL